MLTHSICGVKHSYLKKKLKAESLVFSNKFKNYCTNIYFKNVSINNKINELRDPAASTQVLGLKICTTTILLETHFLRQEKKGY